MDDIAKDRVLKTIASFLTILDANTNEYSNSLNKDTDKNTYKRIDIHLQMFTYLLSNEAKLFILTYKKFRNSVQKKISEFREDDKVKENNKFMSIMDEINRYIFHLNLEDEFLELRLNV